MINKDAVSDIQVTVLLVEKDATIRQDLSRILTYAGCVVFEAESNQRAQAILAKHGSVIDRVIALPGQEFATE